MKIALSVAMVSAMTTTAMAEMKVSGLVRAYGGQTSSNDVDTTGDTKAGAGAHLTAHSQINLVFKGGIDNTTVFADLDEHNGGSGAYSTTDTDKDFQPSLNLYTLFIEHKMDKLSVKLGDIYYKAGDTFARRAGIKTKLGGYSGVFGKDMRCECSITTVKAPGIGVKYAISDKMNVGLALHVADKIGGSYGGSGSGNQLAFEGNFADMIDVRVSIANSTSDKHAGGKTDALSHNNTHIGVGLNIAGMFIGVGSGSKTVAANADTSNKTDETTFIFKMKAGPGKVIATMGTQARAKNTDTGGLGEYSASATNLVYDIPLGKGAGVQAVYASNSQTSGTADAITGSYIGGGLYSAF